MAQALITFFEAVCISRSCLLNVKIGKCKNAPYLFRILKQLLVPRTGLTLSFYHSCHQQCQKNNSRYNPVPSKYFKAVLLQILNEKADGQHCDNKGSHISGNESGRICAVIENYFIPFSAGAVQHPAFDKQRI